MNISAGGAGAGACQRGPDGAARGGKEKPINLRAVSNAQPCVYRRKKLVASEEAGSALTP
ncbi:Protein of unknown function [Gryllus bimaculatus]|nr:Protein of unknown function [Gryllus bimaculatus]